MDDGVGVGAYFLDAPDLKQVLKLAQEGKTLPQKSTYFHPKPMTATAADASALQDLIDLVTKFNR